MVHSDMYLICSDTRHAMHADRYASDTRRYAPPQSSLILPDMHLILMMIRSVSYALIRADTLQTRDADTHRDALTRYECDTYDTHVIQM